MISNSRYLSKSDTCTQKTEKWSRVIVKHPKWTTKPTIQWFHFYVEDMLRDQLPLDGSVWLLTLEPLVDKFAFLRVPWINIRPRGGEKIWRWKILYMWWLMNVAIYIYIHMYLYIWYYIFIPLDGSMIQWDFLMGDLRNLALHFWRVTPFTAKNDSY